MITIDLGLYASGTSVCTLCRGLIRKGMAPSTVVNFVREGVPVFADVKPISYWASKRVTESNGEHFPRLVSYQVAGHYPQPQEKDFTHVEA